MALYNMELRTDNNHPNRHHNPAVFWLLIIVLMSLGGLSVKVLSKPQDLTSNIQTPLPTDVREPRVYTISYKGGVFSPTNLRIHDGDTVRFKNDGFFGIRIVSDSQTGSQVPMFDSVGNIPQGSYFSYTFSEKGTFGYHNSSNSDEAGTIIVR